MTYDNPEAGDAHLTQGTTLDLVRHNAGHVRHMNFVVITANRRVHLPPRCRFDRCHLNEDLSCPPHSFGGREKVPSYGVRYVGERPS